MRLLIAFLLFLSSTVYGQGLQQLKTLIRISSLPAANTGSFTSSPSIDATGESYTFIGRVHVTGGIGSKTISAAGGGRLRWRVNTTTWANASTNFRIGLQDVGANGIEDGTFDVYADLVPGTETIAGNTSYSTAMESGTKTVSEGDLMAISFELTNRAGADAVTLAFSGTPTGTSYYYPYGTSDTGSGPGKVAAAGGGMGIVIEFDDGTIGYISFDGWTGSVTGVTGTSTFHVNTAGTDEYATVFKVPFKCLVQCSEVLVGSLATTDDFEIIFYTDPLGTPVASQTISYDPDFTGSTSATNGLFQFSWTTSITLYPDTWYGVAIRPTTTNPISTGYYDFLSGNEKYKALTDFGTDIKFCGRLNQSGAFSEVQTYQMPLFSIYVSKLDDGVRGLKY